MVLYKGAGHSASLHIHEETLKARLRVTGDFIARVVVAKSQCVRGYHVLEMLDAVLEDLE
jgi:hypothetical protein